MTIKDDKLGKLFSKINAIDVTLAAQHVELKEHIRRTENLESRLAPIEKHIVMESAMLRVMSRAVGLIGLGAAITEILVYFHK